MGNMSPYYFKTIFTLCMEGIPSFIKIGGAVSEKNGNPGHTFVVLYIGWFVNFVLVLESHVGEPCETVSFLILSWLALSAAKVTCKLIKDNI